MEQIKIYLQLYYEFFKIGLFSIGGGQATIPFLEALSVNTGWFSASDLSRFIAISESTPGAIGVNMSTFAGYLASGDIIGAIIATLGLISPSVIIILLISMSLSKFQSSQNVKYVFYGLRPASTALITAALYTLTKAANLIYVEKIFNTYTLIDVFDFKNCLIAVVLGGIIFKYKTHPLFYIAIAAVVGIILKV
ncbi:MAG: chromate transporter [bacterium]